MISLGPTSFTLEVVQNQNQWFMFRLFKFWDERQQQIVQDVTGWAFTMLVKRRLDDSDPFAVFEITNNVGAPAPAGLEVPIAINGDFYFVLNPTQTDIAPEEYFGEIRGWNAGLVPGVDPPTIKFPFTYKVDQTLDLVYP